MTFATTAALCSSALLLGASGALTAEKGGVPAWSIEGVMLAGGLAGTLSSRLPLPLCLLLAGGAGLVYALLFSCPPGRKGCAAFSGLAAGAAAAALAMILARLLGGVSYSRKPFALLVSGENATVFLPLALTLAPGAALLMYRSGWGLRLRLCGMDGEAALRSGIRVRGMRLMGISVYGFLAGLGGLAALISQGAGWQLKWGAGGMGLLSLAAVRGGKHRLPLVLLWSLLLGIAQAGAEAAAQMDLGAPDALWKALPFALALILAAGSGEEKANTRTEEESI